jgi:hypothetical protein
MAGFYDLLNPGQMSWGQVGPTPNWGAREDGSSKGRGHLGPVHRPDGGVSTELSASADGMQFPLVVPTLTQEELQYLMSGQPLPSALVQKAVAYAQMRMRAGLSPFFDK